MKFATSSSSCKKWIWMRDVMSNVHPPQYYPFYYSHFSRRSVMRDYVKIVTRSTVRINEVARNQTEKKAKFIGTTIYRRWQHKAFVWRSANETNIDWDTSTHTPIREHTRLRSLGIGPTEMRNRQTTKYDTHTRNWNRKHELVIFWRCIIFFVALVCSSVFIFCRVRPVKIENNFSIYFFDFSECCTYSLPTTPFRHVRFKIY